MIGLIGRKVGMTQVFDPKAGRVTVTVIQAGPCTVTGLRTSEKDGYQAVQLGFEELKKNSKKNKRINKAYSGIFAKNNLAPVKVVKEFRVDDSSSYKVGQIIDLAILEGQTNVDVTGVSIGRGFQGVVKRWGMAGGPETHGSNFHRRPGSIGSNTCPARVWKGKKMGGHMGCETVTMKNLKLIECDKENNLVLVKGSVAGNENDLLFIKLRKS